ncbi:g3629 [Coccomyxa viridis]|uniref:G3629 protein n=1 Tax=Coccomyxa viridis TaxID=1274662 RepID=A0ABP1FN95_9CHLO
MAGFVGADGVRASASQPIKFPACLEMCGHAVMRMLRQLPPVVTTLTRARAQQQEAAPGVRARLWEMLATPRMTPNGCHLPSSAAQMRCTMHLGQHHELHDTAAGSGSVPDSMSVSGRRERHPAVKMSQDKIGPQRKALS